MKSVWTIKKGDRYRIRLDELIGFFYIEERRWKYLPFWKRVAGTKTRKYQEVIRKHLYLNVKRNMK